MKKKRKKKGKKGKDTMSSVAMSGVMGLTVTGTMAGATGQGAGISANYGTGVSNIGRQLPTMGKIKGAGMVFRGIGKLKPRKLMKKMGGQKL